MAVRGAVDDASVAALAGSGVVVRAPWVVPAPGWLVAAVTVAASLLEPVWQNASRSAR